MNIGIVYYSKTGNTKKLANVARDEFIKKGDTVTLLSIEKCKEELNFDLLLLGTYCSSNSFPKKFKQFLKKINPSNAACFLTHSTEKTGKYYDTWAKGCEDEYKAFCDEHKLTNNYFHCQAKPSGPISIFIKLVVFKNARADWDNYRKTMNLYPREEEINDFKNWINTLL